MDRRGGTLPKVPRPSAMYLFLGIVLHNDKETYVGAGKVPLGLGKTDTAQVIQLSATAGEAIWKALSEVRDEYRGVETDDYAKALVYGDPVHPEQGIFLTVMGRHAATPYSEPVGGYDLDAEAGRLPGRDRESFGRYTVSFSRQLAIEGRTIPHVSPALPPKAVERILNKAVQFDNILYIPTTEELCLLCARAWKSDPYILEYGWGDHPQFFTAEVRKILTNARTWPSAAGFASSGNGTLEEPSDAAEDLGEMFSAAIFPLAAKPREESPAGGQDLPADPSSLDTPEAVFSPLALDLEDGDAPDGGMVPKSGVFGEAAPCTEAKEIPSAAGGERPRRQAL